MYFKQFYLGCLAHASYLVGSDGEAAVIDPQRDVDQYLDEARAQGLRIKYVIETHLHADFVSGHRELAERAGAEIVFGHRAGAEFPHRAVREGDELHVGRLRLRVLETPGHTPEGISLVLVDEGDQPRMVFTGDTLFVGDVGRPDLVGAMGHTAEQMASMLYDSLHAKLLKLPDEVEVYPAHGAGSLCGRNLSKETSSTIGEQRRVNYALRPMSREAFVKMATADLPEVPRYFAMDVEMNRQGAGPIAERPLPPALEAAQVARRAGAGAVVLDVRNAGAYATGHVPGAINVGLGGQFASWAGTLIAADGPVVLVADDEDGVREAVMRLSRVGLENVEGFLAGGLASWDEAGLPVARLPQVTVDELRARLDEDEGLQVLDVRRPSEYASGHVPRAVNVPLDTLALRQDLPVDPQRPLAVVCAGGYRSAAACSLLEKKKYRDLVNVVGGTSAWTAAGYPTEEAAA